MIEPFAVEFNEACRLIPCGRSTLYDLIAKKKLRLLKLGRKSMIPIEDIRALVDSLKTAA
jgi:excisionase family DNA binding protein